MKCVPTVLTCLLGLTLAACQPGQDTASEEAPAQTAATPPPAPAPPPPAAQEWHEGGTLHDVNMTEWIAGTDEDRLATAADMATDAWERGLLQGRNILHAEDWPIFRLYAMELRECLTGAGAYTLETYMSPVAEVAAACMIELRWDVETE